MAKYTELFIDYVRSGREMPAIFEQIDGFESQFIANYADSEIGFETPDLFALKLENKANIVIPYYKEKIEVYDNLLAKYKEYKGREITETTSNSRDKVYNYGETQEQTDGSGVNGAIKTRQWELPNEIAIDTLDKTPPTNGAIQNEITNTSTGKTIRSAYENKDTDDFSQTFIHTENMTNAEILDQIKSILGLKTNLIKECIDEFNSLFIQVW